MVLVSCFTLESLNDNYQLFFFYTAVEQFHVITG